MAWARGDREPPMASPRCKSSGAVLALLASDRPEPPAHCAPNGKGRPDSPRGLRYRRPSLWQKRRALTCKNSVSSPPGHSAWK